MFIHKTPAVCFNRLPDLRKLFHDLRFCTSGLRRVRKILMQLNGVGRKERASFFCVIANRDHKIEINTRVFADIVGCMTRDIYPVFRHSSNSTGIYAMCFNTRAVYFRPVACKVPEISFCDLAAAAVAGTEY